MSKKESLKPAIVIGTHSMGLGVIRALGIMGVPIIAVYYESGDMGYVSKYVKEVIRAPHPEKAEDQFVDLLVKSAARFGGGLLIPTYDDVLAPVSRHKDLLEQHYIVACPEWDITKLFVDKMHTYALADSIGVPAPATTIPRSIEDVEQYSKSVQYPCLVKPRQGHQYFEVFKRKMVLVNNFDEMVAAYQEAANFGLEVMIQEVIPGDDDQVVNYNSYFWDGEPLAEFTAQQIRKAPPNLGSPRVVVSKDISEIVEPGRSILRSMGFFGYSCTEFKKDSRDGVYKLMEVNGRHNRSTILAVRCGLNFPWLQYKHLVQGELPAQSSYKTGVYWINLDRDVGYSIQYWRKERYSPRQYLQPYFRPHVFDIFAWNDLMPFIRRCYNLMKSAIQAILPGVKKGSSALDIGG